jgi:hypothetical protein
MIGALRVFFLLAALALAIVGATDGKVDEHGQPLLLTGVTDNER